MASYIAVSGLDELVAGLEAANTEQRAAILAALERVGNDVRRDAAEKLLALSGSRFGRLKSAQGYKVRLRLASGRGVVVEQSLRKTTGKRPDYGALQMRHALIPALYQNEDKAGTEVYAALETLYEKHHLIP